MKARRKKTVRGLRPLLRPGIGRAVAAMNEARAKLGPKEDTLSRITEKARVLHEPHYTTAKYCEDLLAFAVECKKQGDLKRTLSLIKETGVKVKAGSNDMLVLIKRTSEFDAKRAGKLAKELSQALAISK